MFQRTQQFEAALIKAFETHDLEVVEYNQEGPHLAVPRKYSDESTLISVWDFAKVLEAEMFP